MAKPVSCDLAARYQAGHQAGDEPLQQEDPQFPMPWIKCPRVALVTSVRNENSYAGLNLFVRLRIAHHPGGGNRHMRWGTGVLHPE